MRRFLEIAGMLDKKCKKLCQDLHSNLGCDDGVMEDELVEKLVRDFEKDAQLTESGCRKEFSSAYLTSQYFGLKHTCCLVHFEIALRLHTKHCPKPHTNIYFDMYYRCYDGETTRIKKVVINSIWNALLRNEIVLQDLVVKAAADANLSLDGLYEIIRIDPISALLPRSSASVAKKRKREEPSPINSPLVSAVTSFG